MLKSHCPPSKLLYIHNNIYLIQFKLTLILIINIVLCTKYWEQGILSTVNQG